SYFIHNYLFHFLSFNHPSPTSIYTLSLHDALPIFNSEFQVSDLRVQVSAPRFSSGSNGRHRRLRTLRTMRSCKVYRITKSIFRRSEVHTSELQSRENLVCRLLLEKKK